MTVATDQDVVVVDTIHEDLRERALLAEEQVVDAAYVSSQLLVRSQDKHGIDLIGPVRPNVSWQAGDEHAFDLAAFTIDWDAQVVICPMGKPSRYWGPARGPRGKPFIQVQFRKGDCLARSARSRCTRSQSAPRGLR